MQITPELILGGGGALALSLWIIQALWKSHLASDAREQKRADDADARADKLIAILERAKRPNGLPK